MLATRPKLGSDPTYMGPLNYDELPGLEDVYLEDSFVLDLVQSPTYLSFTLTAAIRPSHPSYEPPPSGEKHCFRTVTLTFPAVQKQTWEGQGAAGFTDAAGAVDYGNIDMFIADPRGFYHLEGDWGSVDVVSGAPQLDILSPESEAHARRAEELAAWIAGRPVAEHGHDHDHDHDHDHE